MEPQTIHFIDRELKLVRSILPTSSWSIRGFFAAFPFVLFVAIMDLSSLLSVRNNSTTLKCTISVKSECFCERSEYLYSQVNICEFCKICTKC